MIDLPTALPTLMHVKASAATSPEMHRKVRSIIKWTLPSSVTKNPFSR